MWTHMNTCMWRPNETVGVFLNYSLIYLSGSLTEPEAHLLWLVQLDIMPQRLPVSASWVLVLQETPCLFSFYKGARVPCPHTNACTQALCPLRYTTHTLKNDCNVYCDGLSYHGFLDSAIDLIPKFAYGVYSLPGSDHYLVSFRFPNLCLTFRGCVIGPTFHFNVPALNFGNVSYGE
jgi:hypothetical protein